MIQYKSLPWKRDFLGGLSMERRFEIRKRQLLAECEVHPAVFEGAAERLAELAKPFLDWLGHREQRECAQTYLAGLVSDVETKNVESSAYLHDQERHRLQATCRAGLLPEN